MAQQKKKAKRKETQLVKPGTIKTYTNDVLEVKISATTERTFRIRFNKLMKDTLREATKNMKAERGKVIMPRHLEPAFEKIVGKKNLDIPALLNEIKSQSAVDLGNLVAGIETYAAALEKKDK